MHDQLHISSMKIGIAGGTLLTIFVNLNSEDIIKTAILAAVGAIVSFCISLALKTVIKNLKDRFSR
jgi:small-conductance mechanosensitive channel